ncbi:MAG: asparagine synthase (glutamine-hydrolyzing) [Chitinophagaceae bacterium]|nr:asparagine synthase (glutamine-hydrolyzing) [Chitinophagaceae bacterium]
MCGIAGFISPNLNRDHLHLITRALQHRGPDAEGFYFDAADNIGLGHRRLSIIDLSEAANQPFYSHDGRYAMIYNGEVYNFKELTVKYNIQPRTSSDSEIILEAFAQKGVECINDFNGMFALAIWDTQDKKLFVIRDRFGVKPVVYYLKGNDFAFASELKALLKLPVEKKINPAALQDYLFLEYIPDAKCILQDFYKLPKGHYLVADNGKVSVKPYYQFIEKIVQRPLAPKKEDDALNEFEDLLGSAVKYRQISDVPIGAFLSGGTDSSLICALFQKQNTNPVNTFTIGFDVAGYDESGYASQVAGILKTNHSETHLSDKSSIEIADRIVDHYDEPFAAPSTIPSYLVCNVARKKATVAMSGDGGDELFMGYGYYDLYRKVKKIYRMDAGIGRHLIKAILSMKGGEKYGRASRLFNLPSKDMLAHLWSEQQYMFSEKEIRSLLNVSDTDLSIKDSWRKVDAMDLSDFEKISLFDIEQYLAYNLLYKMDIASMANSLEVRNPYLDYRLMEYSFNLPQDFKIKDGTAKYLMKKLLERYLPKELVYRRKWGFPAPLGDWMGRELSYLLDKWLAPGLIRSQGIFNEKVVARFVNEFKAGKKYHDKRVWSLIFFQMWYAKYIDGNGN